MKILGIDTTRKMARFFIIDGENIYHLNMNEDVKHSEGIFLYLEKALFECKLKLSDIDVFCGVVGPGSFTGIRVGMSVLKSFNIANNKKLLPINTFEILSIKYKSGVILLKSTNTSCYYAKIEKYNIVESGVIENSKVSEFCGGNKAIILKEEQDSINIEYNNIELVDDISEYYYDAVAKKLESETVEDFVPYYLQLSQAERNVKSE